MSTKLSDKDIADYCRRLGLSERALAEIQHIRSSPPARRVQSRVGNVRGHFNRSRKMGHTVQSESRTVEKPAIMIMELREDDVIEFWDQPPSFVINYRNSNGRNYGHVYTADFFVLRKASAGWEEWKKEEELRGLSEKNPQKYCLGRDGLWHCPPAERHAEQFGLYHRVRSDKEISWTLIRNINLLMPFYVFKGQTPE